VSDALPRPSPAPVAAADTAPPRSEELRKLTYLMLFRVGLVSVLLLATVLLNALGPAPEELAKPFSLFILGLIVTTYGLTLLYARSLRRVRRPARFATIQIGVDLCVITALVHGTGGAESAFTFLFSITIIAASMVLPANAARMATVAAALLYVGVSLLGHYGVLPPVLGQRMLPSQTSPQEFGRALIINLATLTAVAVLASNLAAQLLRAGERLAHQEARFSDLEAQSEDVIRCLTSGLITTDRQGRILSFNQAASEITGHGRAQAVGRSLGEVLPALCAVPERRSGDADRAEVAAVRPDGSVVPIGVSVSPLTNRVGDVVGRIFNFQNLSELKRMEAVVKRTERMAAVGQLAATMAHEIRNPLASISGAVELLRTGPTLGDEDRRLMEIVLREVERLNRLITELLDFARPRQPNRARLDMCSLVREALSVFEHERGEAIKVALEAPAPVHVDADAAQVHQVVWNLLKNASEAMPDGGTITLALAQEGSPAARVAVLTVRDQGKGIAQEHLERVFEPFFTTKTHGTGLGLAMVQRLVSDHGGSIDLTSTEGVGTTAVVKLPAA
jgi:two-component system sensor histidine kinase PilS (NtrC family)